MRQYRRWFHKDPGDLGSREHPPEELRRSAGVRRYEGNGSGLRLLQTTLFRSSRRNKRPMEVLGRAFLAVRKCIDRNLSTGQSQPLACLAQIEEAAMLLGRRHNLSKRQ